MDVEIPCPATGVLARILAEPGQTVPVGEPIAEIDTGDGGNGDFVAHGDANPPSVTDSPSTQGEADRSGFVSPVVRRMADEHHVDLSRVEGHGVGGRIRKKDLLASSSRVPSRRWNRSRRRPLHTDSPYVPDSPAPSRDGIGGEPMSPMRKAIAEHMVRSVQTAAHCTTIVEVDFSAVASRRTELKPRFADKGVPLTYLAFVARAVVESLEEFPALNSSVEGDELVRHADVNLGIAVSLDAGLIVPVIPQAQRLSLEGTGRSDR